MKLRTLINKLEKAEAAYKKKHGTDPVIWDWSFGELELCAKRKRISAGTTTAEKPYLKIKIEYPGND